MSDKVAVMSIEFDEQEQITYCGVRVAINGYTVVFNTMDPVADFRNGFLYNLGEGVGVLVMSSSYNDFLEAEGPYTSDLDGFLCLEADKKRHAAMEAMGFVRADDAKTAVVEGIVESGPVGDPRLN